jgi:cysteine-rich repeat protein
VASSITTSNVVWTPEDGDFTMEAWVNVTTNTGALFGLGRRTGDDHVWVGLSEGRVVFEYRLSADELVQVTGTTNLNGAGWHHVAAVRFATWGAALFVNGRLEAIAHQARTAGSINGTTHIWVGSDSTTTSAGGRIDHLRLSDVQRYSDYFTPVRRYAADGATIGLYNFDDATNNALADTSGNGRNLTVANITRTGDACYGAPANSLACGDGVKASWEGCDDGNTTSGDGCSSGCVTEVCRSDERLGPGGHCYHVITSTRNWDRAQDDCDDRGSGSNLVTVDSATENTWMTFMLGLSGSHWIGLTDSGWGNEGEYRWVRGSSGYRYWASGEPNDGGSWTTTEDCVGLFGTSGGANAGRWNDFRCTESLRAVCERY